MTNWKQPVVLVVRGVRRPEELRVAPEFAKGGHPIPRRAVDVWHDLERWVVSWGVHCARGPRGQRVGNDHCWRGADPHFPFQCRPWRRAVPRYVDDRIVLPRPQRCWLAAINGHRPEAVPRPDGDCVGTSAPAKHVIAELSVANAVPPRAVTGNSETQNDRRRR